MKYTNLGLPLIGEEDKPSTSVGDFIDAIASEDGDSAFKKIDALITEIHENNESAVVFSETQPDNQKQGDIWNQIL